MKGLSVLKHVAIALAAFGTLMPNAGSVARAADAVAKAKPPIKISRPGTAADISLSEKGEFAGRVFDHTGRALEGAEVVVRQGDKVIAKSVTNDKGLFTIAGVKAGAYQVKAGNTEGLFQVWELSSAPESAKGHALLVTGENGARGQFGAIDPALLLLTAVTIASLIIAIISLSEINDSNDKIDELQAQLDAILNSL